MSQMRAEVLTDRRVTLDHLRAFVAVAELGGFHEAGRSIYRTQSAVTQSIKRLEAILRCRLFDRGKGRQLTGLTGDGQRLLPEVKEILARLDSALNLLQHPELKGHITLGMQPSTNTDELQTAIASCMALNKGLRIQVISELSFRLLEMLDQGVLDVAIICRNAEEAPPAGSFQHVLTVEPLVWAGQRHEDFSRVEEIPLVCAIEGCTNRAAAEATLSRAGRPYYLSFVTSSWGGVHRAVAAGFGISALAPSEVAENLVVLDQQDGLPPLPPMYTLLRARTQSPVIWQFCELIRSLPGFGKP